MGSRGAPLTAGLTALLLAACGGDRAVGVAAEFVRAARTVRLHVQDKAQAATRTVEIVCPDRVRVTAETASGRLEVVGIGDQAYGRTGEGAWIRVPLSFVNAPAICPGATWRPQAQDLATLLQAMTELAVSEQPIGPRAVNGVACQDWEARERGPAPAGDPVPRILMCLGTVDKRPMQITLPDATWTFAEWNADLTIEPPQAVTGEPVAAVRR
ncbi:MAG TPA: hypothetical protein VJ794_10945 [Gemmatimonadales bacterium]|nr:hypothetical protein [Gemmatimonadales bacterium]